MIAQYFCFFVKYGGKIKEFANYFVDRQLENGYNVFEFKTSYNVIFKRRFIRYC